MFINKIFLIFIKITFKLFILKLNKDGGPYLSFKKSTSISTKP